MQSFFELIKNFFTHKDHLPPAYQIAGTLFTPLHIIFAAVLLSIIMFLAVWLSRKQEKTIRTVFAVLWPVICVLEITKIVWETFSGATVRFEFGGILPLYPCSIFMYAMPFAIWGHGKIRYMGCGYICTLGLLGGATNFIYPANILQNYSCISFAGFHTFLYHGSIVFCAVVMLLSHYHSYKSAKTPLDLLLPAIPALATSVIANIVNFSKINSDYMFFKLSSFFFAPIGAATHDAVSVILVYMIYLIIHSAPYIPGYISNLKKAKKQTAETV